MQLQAWWPVYYSQCSRRLRECTLIGYESAWRRHCQPIAGLDMDSLDSLTLQAWLDGNTISFQWVAVWP